MLVSAGFTLLADNLVPFSENEDWFILLILMIPMIMGNQAFPFALRSLVHLRARFDKANREVYDYLLEHPRRCSTHMFPARETTVLTFVLFGFLITEFAFFLLLDRNATIITDRSWGMRVLIALFQAASTRTAGFNCVDLAKLSAAMNVLYLVGICSI